jgi:hypothetical protein
MSFGMKVCPQCNTAYSEHYQFTICPHDYREYVADCHDEEIKRFFHKLWGRDAGTEGYTKKDWLDLQRLLQARGINV